MKKLLSIYLLSLVSTLFVQEANAGDPFNVKPWEVDPEGDQQKLQNNDNQAEEGNASAESNQPE